MRRFFGGLLALAGALVVVVAVTVIAAGKEVALGLAELCIGAGAGLGCGWLLWRGFDGRQVSALALWSWGMFMVFVGLDRLVSNQVSPLDFWIVELRFGGPALIAGWLLWYRRQAVWIVIPVIVSWAISAALQALKMS